MNKARTIMLKAEYKDEDGNVQGGMNLYWTPGVHIVLIQEWEHMAAGPVWGQVIPDPMEGSSLLSYFLDNWQGSLNREYNVVDVKEFS